MEKSQITVIAVGGSLIVPHLSDTGGIDVPFLRAFRKMLLAEVKKPARRGGGGQKFVLVAGGGKTARVYQKAGRELKISNDNLDWIGIYAIQLNVEFLRIVFREFGKNVVVAGGVKPGQSTDHVAVALAQKHKAKNVIIAGDTPFVYEKDPKKFPKAKALPELTWSQYEKLVPKKWTPGMSAPVDPVAAKLAKKLKLEVRLIKGTDMKNFQAAIEGKKFTGTIIR